MKRTYSFISLKNSLVIMTFLLFGFTASATTFNLQKRTITGDKIRAIVSNGFDYLYGVFETSDGVNYKLRIYAQNGNKPVVEITDNFTDAGYYNHDFPCVFGNIKWKVKIPSQLKDTDSYTLTPTIGGDNNIFYSWSANTGNAPNFSTGFNPVPPRTAALTLILVNKK